MRNGDVRHTSVGRELLTCRKSVHPGVQSLWEFHEAGDPARVTLDHNGCGAAIRVAPVGMIYRSHRLDDIVAGARQASISTHGGAIALAAAAATAAAVSAAIDGADGPDILRFAQVAGGKAEQQRTGSGDTAFAGALGSIYDELSRWPQLDADAVARQVRADSSLDHRAAGDRARDAPGLGRSGDHPRGEYRRRQRFRGLHRRRDSRRSTGEPGQPALVWRRRSGQRSSSARIRRRSVCTSCLSVTSRFVRASRSSQATPVRIQPPPSR